MTGDDMRQVFKALLPQEETECPYAQFGVTTRQCTLNPDMLGQAWVISAGTPSEAYQANVPRSYVEFEVPRVTCSAFYRWFGEPLERLMEALIGRPLKSVPLFNQADAESSFPVITLLHASLIAPIIATFLAHTHNVKARPQQNRRAMDKGAAASPALGLAVLRLLSVHCAGLRPEGGRVVLEEDGGVAHVRRSRFLLLQAAY